MDILPVNFKILSFCGIWREEEDIHVFKRLVSLLHGLILSAFRNFWSMLYYIRIINFLTDYYIFLLYLFHRSMVVTIIFYFTLVQFIKVIVSHENLEDITESLFMIFTYVALCFKCLNFLLRKEKLLILLNLLREKIYRPRNLMEAKILENYSRRAKWCTLSFMALCQSTAVALITAPIMELHRSTRPLPCRAYIPYSIEGLHAYLATYLIHAASIIYGILLNVSLDSLVYGLTLHVCGQIDILCERCMQTIREGNSNEIKACVRHHVFIHDLVRRIEYLFIWTVAFLLFFSLVTLCTTIFQMSKKNPFTVEFCSYVLYTGCIMFQIFCYCWYGNELRLKGKEVADAIYNSDWVMSTQSDRRNLQFLMRISQKELTLSYHRIFSLNLDAFTWILKTSYSSFNILQTASI